MNITIPWDPLILSCGSSMKRWIDQIKKGGTCTKLINHHNKCIIGDFPHRSLNRTGRRTSSTCIVVQEQHFLSLSSWIRRPSLSVTGSQVCDPIVSGIKTVKSQFFLELQKRAWIIQYYLNPHSQDIWCPTAMSVQASDLHTSGSRHYNQRKMPIKFMSPFLKFSSVHRLIIE